MNCPRCNVSVAFTKSRCDNCGQDLVSYRKVVSLSNIYYNKGLSQAKIRDLSGAISSLKQSLQFNKLNTSARNLLGLIYYEEGEIVAALSEWVISKHYQNDNNDADMYIKEIQANPNKLEMHNQTIRKYNSALNSAKHGDEDMAIIQLKKVVNTNPKFIRANQLLALLYMMSGKKENRTRAMRLLKNIIKVDVTNTTTLRYMKELSDVHIKPEPVIKTIKKEESRKTLPRVDADAYKTITPYKEEKPSVLPFVNVLVGIIIGLAVMYFLVVPHIKSNLADDKNNNFKQYSEQQASDTSNNSSLKNENAKLKGQVDELKSQLDKLQGGDGTSDNPVDGETLLEAYDNLFAAVQLYIAGKTDEASEKLVDIDEQSLTSKAAKKLYNKIKSETFAAATVKYFEQGRDAYNGEGEFSGNQDYDKAIELLNLSLQYDETNTDSMYFLGRCYQKKGDNVKAKEYYNQIINDYPDSTRVPEARAKFNEIG